MSRKKHSVYLDDKELRIVMDKAAAKLSVPPESVGAAIRALLELSPISKGAPRGNVNRKRKTAAIK